jgi:hypothetical protein
MPPGWSFGDTTRLPPGTAGEKLLALREADETARTLLNDLADRAGEQRTVVQRANQRLAALEGHPREIAARHADQQTVPNPSIVSAEHERDTAQAQLDRLIERQTAIRATRWTGIGQLEAWVKTQSSFTLAPPVVIPKGATLAKARAKLDEIAADRRAVESAPLPKADAVTAIRAQVAALATPMEAHGRSHTLKIPSSTTRPQLFGQAGGQPLSGFASVEQVSALGLMAWLFEDEIVARLAETVEEHPAALTDAQRKERLAELDAEKLEIERVEEALLNGELRRVNAAPQAVLGLA